MGNREIIMIFHLGKAREWENGNGTRKNQEDDEKNIDRTILYFGLK
jgi:hypothetical protein